MKNDIYSMLNEAEINLDDYKKEDFNHIEKKQIKASLKRAVIKKKSYKRNIIAASVVIALTIVMFGTNVGAQALTRVLKIAGVEDIGKFLGIRNNLDKYRNVINKSITDNGITIQLNEAILDETEINVSYNIKTDRKLTEDELMFPLEIESDVFINGKKLTKEYGEMSRKIDDYNAQDVISYKLGNESLSGDLDIRIECSAVRITGEGERNGQWEFEFEANGDELEADTKAMKLNNKITLENGAEYTLEKYTDNFLGQRIYASVSNSKAKLPYAIRLEGKDDFGYRVTFTGLNVKEKSVILKVGRGESTSPAAKKLTLTPYFAEMPKGGGNLTFKQAGEPFTIDLSKLK